MDRMLRQNCALIPNDPGPFLKTGSTACSETGSYRREYGIERFKGEYGSTSVAGPIVRPASRCHCTCLTSIRVHRLICSTQPA